MSELVIAGRDADGNIIEPLRGLRFYNLQAGRYANDWILVGGFGGLWPTIEQRAECVVTPSPDSYEACRQHLLTGTCRCGFYLRTDMLPIESWRPIRATCIGWGAADVWEQGARVEHIRLDSLQINEDIQSLKSIIAALESRYSLPVMSGSW